MGIQSTVINLIASLYVYFYPAQPNEVAAPRGVMHEYDLINDIIKMKYRLQGQEYIACLSTRAWGSSRAWERGGVQKIYFDLVSTQDPKSIIENPVLDATIVLQGKEKDITQRVNSYLGNQGCHLKYEGVKIKWLLRPDEMFAFSSMTIFNSVGDEHIYKDINDTISLH